MRRSCASVDLEFGRAGTSSPSKTSINDCVRGAFCAERDDFALDRRTNEWFPGGPHAPDLVKPLMRLPGHDGPVRQGVVIMPMETEAPAKPEGSLAREFSKLWTSGPSGPDVFAFLSAHPEISDDLRLDVLLVDQHERWTRRSPLPLRVYLSAFPEIAARGEMVRALVDGERAQRRRNLGVLAALENSSTRNVVSETPTQPMEGEPAKDDTEVEGERGRAGG